MIVRRIRIALLLLSIALLAPLALLALFARERGRIVSRRALLVEVWGLRHVERIQTRTVDMHIAKLRKKLNASPSLLETVRGEGYRFAG